MQNSCEFFCPAFFNFFLNISSLTFYIFCFFRWGDSVCVCVCARARMYVYVCMRACACAHVCACVRACVWHCFLEWTHCPSSSDRLTTHGTGGMTVTIENRSSRNTTCPITTLCAIKPTWVDLGLSFLLQSALFTFIG